MCMLYREDLVHEPERRSLVLLLRKRTKKRGWSVHTSLLSAELHLIAPAGPGESKRRRRS